jgi:hypothetical protein
LARLPELDPLEGSRESDATAGRRDGRILSHGLSTKILLGGGALLLLAAIYPFVFGGNDEPKPGTPPAPDAEEAPAWQGESAETPVALPAAENISYEPNMSLNADLPPAPDFIGAAQTPDPGSPPQMPSRDDQGRSEPAGERAKTPAADLQSQTDAGQLQAHANQAMAIGDLAPTSAGIYAGEYRRETEAGARASFSSAYPGSLLPQQKVEPGVARLEGIIEKPSVRTSYDAARSSVY